MCDGTAPWWSQGFPLPASAIDRLLRATLSPSDNESSLSFRQNTFIGISIGGDRYLSDDAGRRADWVKINEL